MFKLNYRKLIRARLAFLIMMSFTLNMVSVGNANAMCLGVGQPHFFVSGELWGSEGTQYGSTCDNDGEYRGEVTDLKTDGKYVQVRLSTRSSMSNEWIQTYTGSRYGRNYRSWGRGTYYLRICKSGTPIGVSTSDFNCTYPQRHQGF